MEEIEQIRRSNEIQEGQAKLINVDEGIAKGQGRLEKLEEGRRMSRRNR
jgi:hypothetical protein